MIKAELYGHYDSRGGATLLTNAIREEADERYNKAFHCGDETIKEEWGDWSPAQEDHIATIFVDVREWPGTNTELGYIDEGELALWAPWDPEWEFPRSDEEIAKMQFVISRESPGGGWHVAEWLGEDAFGVLWNTDF